MSLASILERAWSKRGLLALTLLPFAFVFALLAWSRRALFRLGLLRSHRLAAPVVVVGNISVGGTGKTPLAIWLAESLRRRGFRPGVISRGYGGSATGPRRVSPDDDAAVVGDEPLLIARRTGVPVWIGADRVEAGRGLLRENPGCDLLISDDGLQHYRMRRSVEIVVLNRSALGNGWPLPAGPLREPLGRLTTADAVVLIGATPLARSMAVRLPRRFEAVVTGDRFHRLGCPADVRTVAQLKGLKLHAIAGIGSPRRFFDHLAGLGLEFIPHSFPDHHRYRSGELEFEDCDAILMTEKDAVKFVQLPSCDAWVLPVAAVVMPDLADFILEKINGRQAA